MTHFEYEILKYLADHYRKSKKDTGENKIARKTAVNPSSVYKNYYKNSADYDTVQKLENTVKELKGKGFVDYGTEAYGSTIKTIWLIDEKIDAVETYLHEKYGYTSKNEHLQSLQEIVDRYKDASDICRQECERLQKQIDDRKLTKESKDNTQLQLTEQTLKAIAFIENNTEYLYIREMSCKIFNTSKVFEDQKLKDNVCRLLKKYREQAEPEECSESNRKDNSNTYADSVLQHYNIHKEPEEIILKGNILLYTTEGVMNVAAIPSGIKFSGEDIKKIGGIIVQASNFITIENKTSYMRYKEENSVIFFLSGYMNRFQVEFLRKVYADNPDKNYLHFGDIDAGGFRIFNDLCKKTEIPFHTYHMSKKELMDPYYEKYLVKLSENDRKGLVDLCHNPEYDSTVAYMLERNVKLEQEMVSYRLMKGDITTHP